MRSRVFSRSRCVLLLMMRLLWIAAVLICVGCHPAQTQVADFPTQRERMVKEQIVMRGVVEERVLAAMRKVPREEFVPAEFRAESYTDRPLPIGYDQTISQPFIVAFMTEELRLQGKIMSATISFRAGWWFVAISVEVQHDVPFHSGGAVGIDLGIKTLATLSDGMVFENQRHFRQNLGRIKGLSKGLSRKVEGSQNWWKNTKKLAKAHYRVACQRQDTLHKMTTHVARTYALIGLEDLNTKGMLANHRLAQAVSDASFFEVKRQLLYKAEESGGMCNW